MTKWENLCKNVKPHIGTSVRENTLHQSFEVWLQTIFNWDAASIKHEVPVQMGTETKYADIVLHGGDFDIVFEMKAPGVPFDDRAIGQLNSYMRIRNWKYGFLVGDKLKMFYNVGEAVELVKEVVDIGFDPSNKDGVELGEILDSSVCSNEKLKEYAIEKREQFLKKDIATEETSVSGPLDPPPPNGQLKEVRNLVGERIEEKGLQRLGRGVAFLTSELYRIVPKERSDYCKAVAFGIDIKNTRGITFRFKFVINHKTSDELKNILKTAMEGIGGHNTGGPWPTYFVKSTNRPAPSFIDEKEIDKIWDELDIDNTVKKVEEALKKIEKDLEKYHP